MKEESEIKWKRDRCDAVAYSISIGMAQILTVSGSCGLTCPYNTVSTAEGNNLMRMVFVDDNAAANGLSHGTLW